MLTVNNHIEKLADDLLLKIRGRPLKATSLESLSKALKTDTLHIGAALKALKALGYKIRLRKNGVTFVAATDSLIDTEIAYRLKTKIIGTRITSYGSVKSTNDIAAQMAQNGTPEGAIITAEEQTKGRGRLGRTWHSPSGCGIYASIILKPDFRPEMAPGVAIMTALALADAISAVCEADVKIKWPNDILIAGRKAAGILTELSVDKRKIDYIIVGVGINVNHRHEDFPAELQPTATSLRIVNRRKVRRVELLRDFLRRFESEYRQYCKSQLTSSQKRILRYSSLVGRIVTLRSGHKTVEGLAVDIDSTGALIIEKDGQRLTVTSGEVTVVKK